MKFAACIIAALGLTGGSRADTFSVFFDPPAQARPWAYWYWLDAAVTPAAIDADLQAMKQAGLAGAYLMPISGPKSPPLIDPPATQLSPVWWNDIRQAFATADRLGLKLALHDCDGFATGGGPWITPELSMQRLVWSETEAEGGRPLALTLPTPPSREEFYRDVAVLAFPALPGAGISSLSRPPQVSAGSASGALPAPQYLAAPLTESLGIYGQPPADRTVFQSLSPCWIAFDFGSPFTCRAVTIRTVGNATYGANHTRLEASDDGVHYRAVASLEPPRHGWEDWDAAVTHAVPETTARWYRLAYADAAPAEPGAEDLDSAKWPGIKLLAVQFLSSTRIDNFEGKSGIVWRIAPEASGGEAISLDRIVDLTADLAPDGTLRWTPPPGRWTILRFGRTSTGHRNETGGGGRGLECDKFNPVAARVQFDHWFGEAMRQVGPARAAAVLSIFHIDSWECGSQDWSPVFADEFRRRRGYDLRRYLPAMAGFPVQNAAASERFLRDVRRTIAELVVDNFYRPMAALAYQHGLHFSAESVAATFVSDGMAHFAVADIPMGEFWLRSPTHDKLNDVLDAVSGSRIYGRELAQSEAFTELRLGWDEVPSMLKPLADRNYAFGMNRYVYHVFMLNPWLDRKPGMTLNGVGTFFQRDQTWWAPAGRAWTDYAARCQAVLQQGSAVVDIAVFTGEEVPRRALVPWELASTLPTMLAPRLRARPAIEKPEDWVNPLDGYAYDSINRDALLRLARVENGRLVLPGGASYRLLIVPAPRPMDPSAGEMTPEVAETLRRFAAAGLTIIWGARPTHSPSLEGYPQCDERLRAIAAQLDRLPAIHFGPWRAGSFAPLGLERDLTVDAPPGSVAWTHRRSGAADAYFVSNQLGRTRTLHFSLRARGRVELWDPVTGSRESAPDATPEGADRTRLTLDMPAFGSRFVIIVAGVADPGCSGSDPRPLIALDADWQVQFDPAQGGPAAPIAFRRLESWADRPEPALRHYSGTAVYTRGFYWHYGRGEQGERVWLSLGRVGALASVSVNGRDCGVAWTDPYRVEITSAVREGANTLAIAVTNAWRNRLIGDSALPPAGRTTWTNAPYPPADAPLLASGLMGPVTLDTANDERANLAPAPPGALPSAQDLRRVYEEVKTPFKRGVVLSPGPDEIFDCPSVFRFSGRWYMLFVSSRHNVGYQTHLACSDDLLHWKVLGTVLPFSGQGWDAAQADGGAGFVDTTWNGGAEIEPELGRYWLSYIGGAKSGYETDPLSIGLAATRNPDRPQPWTRLAGNPVLSPGAGPWERVTLFKSTLVADPARRTGFPYLMFYNAKQAGPWVERIGAAASDDLEHWRPLPGNPQVDHGRGITGDPQLVRMGDLWVMFYFGAGWGRGARAFDTFACSRDLIHWRCWEGPYLIAPTEPWDSIYAHKPWVLKWHGVVYHFYCCVDAHTRAIALATSQPLSP